MLFLSHASSIPDPEIQNDPIALAIALAVIVAFVIYAFVKNSKSKQQIAEVPAEVPAEAAAPAPVAPGSAGQLKLHDVEPKIAAMVMAIVADKLGKPLNELRFISIKEVK